MEKLKTSKDKERYQFVIDEIQKFEKLIKGHKKLLAAIGNL